MILNHMATVSIYLTIPEIRILDILNRSSTSLVYEEAGSQAGQEGWDVETHCNSRG